MSYHDFVYNVPQMHSVYNCMHKIVMCNYAWPEIFHRFSPECWLISTYEYYSIIPNQKNAKNDLQSANTTKTE